MIDGHLGRSFLPFSITGHSCKKFNGLLFTESYEPGATVAGVAQRYGIVASKLSTWRTGAKQKGLQASSPAFADLSVMADALSTPFDGIEVAVGAVSVRLPKNTTPKQIADIAKRLAQI